jgi:hypothetical protein
MALLDHGRGGRPTYPASEARGVTGRSTRTPTPTLTDRSLRLGAEGIGISRSSSIRAAIASLRQSVASRNASSMVSPWVIASGKSRHVTTKPPSSLSLTEDEERVLTRRARQARLKRATYVRMLIREEPFAIAADVLADVARRMGRTRLRVSRRK